jgi:coenzyme PQQ synthesis protein D (PqqD)
MSNAGSRAPAASMVVFRADSGDLFTLNASAAVVWRLYAAGRSAEAIARRVSKQYAIDLAEARRDVFAFLAEVRRRGLTILA